METLENVNFEDAPRDKLPPCLHLSTSGRPEPVSDSKTYRRPHETTRFCNFWGIGRDSAPLGAVRRPEELLRPDGRHGCYLSGRLSWRE